MDVGVSALGRRLAAGAARGDILCRRGASQIHGAARHVEPAPEPVTAAASVEGVFGFIAVEIDVKSSGAACAALSGIRGEGDVAQAGGAGRHVQPAPESAPAVAAVGGVLARATTAGALAPTAWLFWTVQL